MRRLMASGTNPSPAIPVSDQPAHPAPVTGTSHDRAAILAFWLDEHGDAMYRYALLRLGSTHAAEDAVQDALLAAIQARFDGKSAVRTWLIGIVRHKVLDEIRRQSKSSAWVQTVHEITDSQATGFRQDGNFDHVLAVWDKPVDGHETELRTLLRDAIDRLPNPMRQAFCLREIDNVPTSEICALMTITKENLWTLVHRAKARLRADITSSRYADGSLGGGR